jgi:hypothetical protein
MSMSKKRKVVFTRPETLEEIDEKLAAALAQLDDANFRVQHLLTSCEQSSQGDKAAESDTTVTPSPQDAE